MPSTLRVEIDGPVGVITLNRPERLNAFNSQMDAELIEAYRLLDANATVRAVVVTGVA